MLQFGGFGLQRSGFCSFHPVILGADFHCPNVFVGGTVDDGLADTRPGLLIELLHDALLQGQFFFHPLAVKAVFQVACGGVGSLGTPIGVDACRNLLCALSVAALLFGGVGNLDVSRADAASGGAALAVLLFAEAEALAEAALVS